MSQIPEFCLIYILYNLIGSTCATRPVQLNCQLYYRNVGVTETQPQSARPNKLMECEEVANFPQLIATDLQT